MSKVTVSVDPSSILQGAGPTTGDITVTLGDIVFPQPRWNDFAVVILEAWASALLRLLRAASKAERIHFMEGPYAVDISRLDGGALRVRALERPNQERACVDVRSLGLVESVLVSAEQTLKICRDRNFWSMDAERLEQELPSLRGEASKLSR